jgi:hypothetical protein
MLIWPHLTNTAIFFFNSADNPVLAVSHSEVASPIPPALHYCRAEDPTLTVSNSAEGPTLVVSNSAEGPTLAVSNSADGPSLAVSNSAEGLQPGSF